MARRTTQTALVGVSYLRKKDHHHSPKSTRTTVHATGTAKTPYYPGLLSVAYKSDQTSERRWDSHDFLNPKASPMQEDM